MALLQGILAGARLLFVHQFTELGLIDLDTLVLRHFEGQLDREAISVVQRERCVAGDHGLRVLLAGRLLSGLLHRDVEDLDAVRQRAAERVLLAVRGFGDIVERGGELGVVRLHRGFGNRQQFRHHRRHHAEHTHRLDGTAQQSAQHIAAAGIARAHTIAHDHQRRTHMVGDDTQLDVGVGVLAVLDARELFRGLDDREDLVGLVDVLLALQQVCQTLKASTGVDVLVLELAGDVQVGLRLDVVDHVVLEHEVPDLDVTVLVGDRAAFLAVLGAAVHIDLRAGAAGAGAAGRPEVVFHAQDLDVLGVDALVAPDGAGFLVVGVGGHPQLFRVEAVAALLHRQGEQLVGVVDGLFLEVVAEREIAQHLEEGAVAGGLAHLFDVKRAHALLVARHAVARRGLLPHQVRDERHHAGDCEQRGGVRRDERSRRHHQMVVLLEIIEIGLCDLRGTHVGGRSLVCPMWLWVGCGWGHCSLSM